MFSKPKYLAYVRKPSVYYLRKLMPDERRKKLLKEVMNHSVYPVVINNNPLYQSAYEMVKKEAEEQRLKYQNSILWSPRFTPTIFKYTFVPGFVLAVSFLLYLTYIAMPRRMMEFKLKRGIRFPELESSGWLDGWYDEYMKPDKLLQLEAHTLEDIEKLHQQGMLVKTKQQALKNIEKKKKKFARGDKSFILEQYKTN